jgi:uncharacterized protein YbjT (DUF2867 family)
MTKILVTGATGNVGSRVVRELQDRGVFVRAFVRNLKKAQAVLGQDLEFAVGDFSDALSVRRALEGVEHVFLACSNDPRQVEYEIGVAQAAVAAGVRRIVKLSALGTEIGSPVAFWDWHGRIEQHLRASGVPSVLLQPSFSMTNLLGASEVVRREGALFAPAKGARISMIDARDVAAAAAVALTTDGHDGQTYVLTGPEVMTYERVAEEFEAATNRRIAFIAVPDEAARQAMIGAGTPEFVANQLVTLFGALRRGVYDRTSDTVRRLTGREPRPFAQFAREHASLFAHASDPGTEVLTGSST